VQKQTNHPTLTADEIADLADRGEDISTHFTNAGKKSLPTQRVNVDFTAAMLGELDQQAQELNISRQAVIKTLIRQGLDQRYLATNHVASIHRKKTPPS
jgi:hypothetical protein